MPALPFTIAFCRPTRGEVLSLSGAAILVGSAASWVGTTASSAPPVPAADPPPLLAPLEITSSPGGAAVVIDGQAEGSTPTTVGVTPGRHNIVLQAQDAIVETRSVDLGPDGSYLALSLWRAHPSVTYLKPPLPGALLGDAVFLESGRLALQVALPDGERQAWTLDPDVHLATQRLGAAAPHAPLAVRPDGQAVAMLQPRTRDPGTDTSPLAFADHIPTAEVWLASTIADAGVPPQRVWTASDRTEELVDLSWAPDDRHLILVGRQPVAGGAARTIIRWLDTDSGEAQDLALLPSEVAPGTYVWSPDGQTVAFIVHTASLAAVCTLSVAGEFRYLGDLGHDGLAGPPVAPVAWAPDSRVLYGALVGQTPASSSSSPFSQNPAGLFLTDPADAPGHAFSSTAALVPLWRPDGRILAVGLPGGQEAGLRLRSLEPSGEARDLGTIDVPAPGPTAYGVRWDLAHSRALVLTNRATGTGPSHDYWLIEFGWSAVP